MKSFWERLLLMGCLSSLLFVCAGCGTSGDPTQDIIDDALSDIQVMFNEKSQRAAGDSWVEPPTPMPEDQQYKVARIPTSFYDSDQQEELLEKYSAPIGCAYYPKVDTFTEPSDTSREVHSYPNSMDDTEYFRDYTTVFVLDCGEESSEYLVSFRLEYTLRNTAAAGIKWISSFEPVNQSEDKHDKE